MIRWRFNEPAKAALALAAVLQVLSMLGFIAPMAVLGFVALPWSTIPAVIVLVIARFPNPDLGIPGRVASAVLTTLAIASMFIFVIDFGTQAAVGVMATAVLEEITFRLAIPLIILGVLIRLEVAKAAALAIGLTASAVLFVLLPGHLQQIDQASMTLVFLAFAAIMSYSVWRSGLIVPAIVAHATINFFTLLDQGNVVGAETRAWAVAATLIALVLISISVADRAELVIDLRDNADAPATVN